MATDIIRRPARRSPWRNPAIRGIVFQVLFVAAILALGAFLVHNTVVNLRRQNIASGFGFLDREAAFGIGESLIPYSPADTYARAFLVGLLNTLYVAGLGIVLATVLGTSVIDKDVVQALAGFAEPQPAWLHVLHAAALSRLDHRTHYRSAPDSGSWRGAREFGHRGRANDGSCPRAALTD